MRSQVPVLFLFMPGVVATAENERPGEAWVLAIGGASSSTGGGGVERQRAASLDANRSLVEDIVLKSDRSKTTFATK